MGHAKVGPAYAWNLELGPQAKDQGLSVCSMCMLVLLVFLEYDWTYSDNQDWDSTQKKASCVCYQIMFGVGTCENGPCVCYSALSLMPSACNIRRSITPASTSSNPSCPAVLLVCVSLLLIIFASQVLLHVLVTAADFAICNHTLHNHNHHSKNQHQPTFSSCQLDVVHDISHFCSLLSLLSATSCCIRALLIPT
jgi:hypothetical protein